MQTAVIGIGSNSLRMLTAEVADGEFHRLKRYRKGLRVFAALDQDGNITPDMIQNACSSVKTFKASALADGAEYVYLFATSAVRDAKNQERFIDELEEQTGLRLEICDGEHEALFSFVGATDGNQSGVIDIGGGSTEIVIGRGITIEASRSLQMGAVRLFRQIAIDTAKSAWAAVEAAKKIIKPHRSNFLSMSVQSWIGVGGTFTTTAALVQRIPWMQREKIHGFVLTIEDVIFAMEHLAPIPVAERMNLPYLQPQRADIIVHGIAILVACMQELNIQKITVSEYGNLEGYLKVKHVLQN